jgi:hypothetical protein
LCIDNYGYFLFTSIPKKGRKDEFQSYNFEGEVGKRKDIKESTRALGLGFPVHLSFVYKTVSPSAYLV